MRGVQRALDNHLKNPEFLRQSRVSCHRFFILSDFILLNVEKYSNMIFCVFNAEIKKSRPVNNRPAFSFLCTNSLHIEHEVFDNLSKFRNGFDILIMIIRPEVLAAVGIWIRITFYND